MKKKSLPLHCKNAAQRVKFLFSRGKEALTSSLPFKEKKNGSKYNHIETPKLPETLKNISIGVLRSELRKKSKENLKKPIFRNSQPGSDSARFFKPSSLPTHSNNELDPKRVQGFSLKEQILASRKLKELGGNEKNASKKFDITVFEETETHPKEDKSNFDQWQDIIKSKETRDFQIGRVIKFLSD